MADVHLTRTPSGLVPSDAMAAEWFGKVKMGAPVRAKVVQPRNGGHHRKFFAMLDVAYSNHEWPETQTQWGPVHTSREMFRKYVICKAGHYEPDLKPDGTVTVVPKSISWAQMDQTEFEALYSDVLDVILAEFLANWTIGDMEKAVEQMMGFC